MSYKLRVLYCYFVSVVVYAIGILFLPPKPGTLQKYHLTLAHLRLIDLTLVILYAAIWFCAAYGFYTLYNYCKLIAKNKDGKHIAKITIGIGFLALWLPATAIFNLYTNYWVQKHPASKAGIAITQNYLSLLIPLIGFIFISMGSRGLTVLAKKRPSLRGVNVLAVLIITIGVMYTHLISTTHNRSTDIYHLSIYFILYTLVAPYVYMWFIGLLSFYEIYIYRQKIAGIIYRSSWRLLSYGLGSLILVTILIQYLTTISGRLNRLSLSWVLVVVYILLLMLAGCYVFIALGAKKLKKIEEV